MAEKFRFTAHLQSLSAIASNYFVESWPGIRYASVREIHHPIAPVTAHTAAYDRDDHWRWWNPRLELPRFGRAGPSVTGDRKRLRIAITSAS